MNTNSKTQSLLKNLSEYPLPIDSSKGSFYIVVPPTPFTVPKGWEFVLEQPFEGVSYIATVLHNSGHRVKIIDVRKSISPLNEALESIIKDAPDFLGIATYEDSFPFVRDLCQMVKDKKPQLPIILGGSLVTSLPQVVMENTLADIAVLGEGELTILELMSALANGSNGNLNNISGLCFKDKNNHLVFNDDREQMRDLDSLPVMNLSLWPQVQKNPKLKQILTSASRGCYMNCAFCYRTTPKLSLKSPEKLQQELKILKEKHSFEFLYFVDLTWILNHKRAEALCNILEEFNIQWSCMTRVQNFDLDLLKKMKKAGCSHLLYGFESVDQEVLDKINKGTTVAEIEKAILLTRQVGIGIAGLFIVGLPGDTEQSLSKMEKFTKKFPEVARVKYLSALPGTPIYREGLEKGIIEDEVEHLNWLAKERGLGDDEFLNFTNLSEERLRKAYYKISSRYILGPAGIS